MPLSRSVELESSVGRRHPRLHPSEHLPPPVSHPHTLVGRFEVELDLHRQGAALGRWVVRLVGQGAGDHVAAHGAAVPAVGEEERLRLASDLEGDGRFVDRCCSRGPAEVEPGVRDREPALAVEHRQPQGAPFFSGKAPEADPELTAAVGSHRDDRDRLGIARRDAQYRGRCRLLGRLRVSTAAECREDQHARGQETARLWTGDARRPRRRQQASGGNAIQHCRS